MNEEEVLVLLVSAEERAKRVYEAFTSVDGGELGWVGRDRQAALKEDWARAVAIRELWVDRPDEGDGASKGPLRRPMFVKGTAE